MIDFGSSNENGIDGLGNAKGRCHKAVAEGQFNREMRSAAIPEAANRSASIKLSGIL